MVALRRKQEPPSHPFAGCYRQYSADSSATAAICIMGYREMDRDNDDSSMMDRAADVDPSIELTLTFLFSILRSIISAWPGVRSLVG